MKGKLIYIATAVCLAVAYSLNRSILFLLIFLLFLVCLYLKKQKLLSLIILIVFPVFYLLSSYIDLQNQTIYKEGPLTFQGRIIEQPVIDGHLFRTVIETDQNEKLAAIYSISSEKEQIALKNLLTGSICSFQADLTTPKHETNPLAFDYHDYLYQQSIHWTAKINQLEGCQQDHDILSKIKQIRQQGLRFIEKYFPEESAGIVQALLYGERSLIDTEVEGVYQELGLIHLLAVSGLHVGILVGGLYYLFIRCGVSHEKTQLILIILLPVYAVLTGGEPSVLRSVLMAGLFLLSKRLKLRVSVLDVISLTCICLLLVNPYYLFHIGFQLSYLCSISIIASAGILQKQTNSWKQLFTVSAIAQVSSLPIILYHFYKISILSLPLNIIFVPFYTVIVLPSSIIVTVFTYFFPTIGSSIIFFFNKMLAISHEAVQFAAELPFGIVVTGQPPTIIILVIVLFSCWIFISLEKEHPFRAAIWPLAGLIGSLCITMVTPIFDPSGEVTMLDVGQGDSLFIEAPFRQGVYLIDTGGKIEFQEEKWEERRKTKPLSKTTIIPFLHSKGITSIDKLFLTHGDLDHAGEAVNMMDFVKIKELVIPIGFNRGSFETEILTKAKQEGVKITEVQAGSVIKGDQVSFFVVSPSKLTESKNDDSIVLYTKIGGLRWLFTGDLEKNGEEEIMRRFPDLRADVLKVGHHGSRGSTSKEFVQQLRPMAGLI
ncbi:DNA internalization-related competence protein ComEC/Rec2 [Metabacillus arenae]|uniref:DNA internalization-related competence protein ComEC/Rec2 n=1 Tax=Metabacillus arenae TaxID=2771434 RepID=A0A926NEL7_9BACI|nr:DNA internalization-related competence protein ComEC/Rec2 [Metabacillus arenae]MBD1382079.1 DNA internalization-related competence protein ComEC/Rec2 [Metabacillus arenae]